MPLLSGCVVVDATLHSLTTVGPSRDHRTSSSKRPIPCFLSYEELGDDLSPALAEHSTRPGNTCGRRCPTNCYLLKETLRDGIANAVV